MFRGEYVSLRIPETDDADIIYGWQCDSEVTKLMCRDYPVSRSDIEKMISDAGSDSENMTFVMDTEDGIPIGLCSLNDIDWINGSAEISVTIYARNCWGRGYGYDAVKTLTDFGFFEMNFHVIYAHILEDNDRAVKCFEKAGYDVEGTLRDRKYMCGCFRNIISMSIVKDGK